MAPSEEDVTRIAQVEHPVLRNLQITACYHELSTSLAERTGRSANWCTFATWASRQAGQTIRKEDLRKKITSLLDKDSAVHAVLVLIAAIAKERGAFITLEQLKSTTIAHLARQVTQRSADAVARGNKKVFEEIGLHFARFLYTCAHDQVYTPSSIHAFNEQLRSGDPPGGQQYLRQAFTRYYASFFESREKQATELRFLANLEIGFHEQTRLQPEIAEALNAAAIDVDELMQLLESWIKPRVTLRSSFGSMVFWVMGKTGLLKKHVTALAVLTAKITRKIATDHLMTLTFPPGRVLMLSRDLSEAYPPTLLHPDHPELLQFLSRVDPTKNSLLQSGAVDWADLAERLHYICELFRTCHHRQDLFDPAFGVEQLRNIREGKVPQQFDW